VTVTAGSPPPTDALTLQHPQTKTEPKPPRRCPEFFCGTRDDPWQAQPRPGTPAGSRGEDFHLCTALWG